MTSVWIHPGTCASLQSHSALLQKKIDQRATAGERPSCCLPSWEKEIKLHGAKGRTRKCQWLLRSSYVSRSGEFRTGRVGQRREAGSFSDGTDGRAWKVVASADAEHLDGDGASAKYGAAGGSGTNIATNAKDTGFVNWIKKEFNVARTVFGISTREKVDNAQKERQESGAEASTSGKPREKFIDSVFGDEDDWTEEMEEDWRFEARGFDEKDLMIRDPGLDGGPLMIGLSPEEGRIEAEKAADIWNIEDWRKPRKVKQGDWDVYDVMEDKAAVEETEEAKSKEQVAAEYLQTLRRRKKQEMYREYEPAEENERLQLPIAEYRGPDTFRETFDGIGEPLQNSFQEVYALMHAFCTEVPFPLQPLAPINSPVMNYGTYFW
jgi:hypothetical protein